MYNISRKTAEQYGLPENRQEKMIVLAAVISEH